MKNLAKIITVLSLLLYFASAKAQLQINAGGDTTICNGGVAILGSYPTAYNGTAPYTYQWAPDSLVDCNNCPNPVAYPSSTTTYTLTVTDHTGASATASTVVTVNPAPALTITATNNTANYFRTDTMTASITNDVPASYVWYLNGAFLSNSPQVEYNYPGIFECIATGTYGCTDTAIQTITGALSVSVSASPNILCYGDSLGTVSASATGGSTPYFYIWNDSVTTQSQNNLAPGVYTVTVFDSQGNVGDASGLINTDNLSAIINVSLNPPDTMEAIVTGGQPPYTYLWSNDAQTYIDTAIASGIYGCTVTDQLSCSVMLQVAVGVVLQNDTFKVPENFSSVLPVLQYAVYDHNFGWQPAISSVSSPSHGSTTDDGQTIIYTPVANYTGADSFTYVACLSDSANGSFIIGYCDTAKVYLTVIDSVLISLQEQPSTCPSSCNGSINLTVSGGVAPYSFLWTTADTTQNLANLCPGIYGVTVTDANHITATELAEVTSYYTVTFLNEGVSIEAIASNWNNDSIPGWVFTWSTGVTDTGYSSQIGITQSGYYCVTASNIDILGGCIVTNCDTVGCPGCVWPGDANDDGIVNNLDLLAVGLGYGATGPAREYPTINWVGQQCANWTDTLPSGTNYKFVDCNGDGTINANDTLAIIQNFDLSHLRGGGIVTPRQGIPELGITLNIDTGQNGSPMVATISLGSSALPANNVYGLAFTFNYDPTIIDSSQMAISIGSSWLGDETDRIYIAPNFAQAGQIQFGITRIDHTTRSGSGPIATVTFVITTDNINGRRGSYSYMATQFFISDLTAIDNNGNVLDINEGIDTAIIEYTSAGINEIPNSAGIKIFPNPANEQLTIENNPTLVVNEIRITDLLGNLVLRQLPGNSNHTVIDVSLLSTGAYFAEVVTGTGNIVKRFVITR